VTPNLPDLSTVQPSNTPPATDTSAPLGVAGTPANFNGMIAAILGDYSGAGTGPLVAPGAGTANGATFIDAGAATLAFSGAGISQFDALFLSIWNSVRLSPSRLVMNGQHAQDVVNRVLGTPQAATFLNPDGTGRANIEIGGFVGSIINKAAGGAKVAVFVEPQLPNGTIIARTDSVPFPGANIDTVWKVRTLRDYSSFEYGAALVAATVGGGPRSDSEVRSVQTLICRAPVAQGVLSNVAIG
jgi:hypothetical protein